MTRAAIIGAHGLLGRELVRAFQNDGWDVIPAGRSEVDLEAPDCADRVAGLRVDVVVNAAAWTDVDGCALDSDRAMRVNGAGAGRVAEGAARGGALAVQISTNEVFPGIAGHAYTERDRPEPINPYGAAKLAGERAVAAATDDHLIIRTAWLFGPDAGFPTRIRAAWERLAPDARLRVVADEWGNPTPAARAAEAMVAAVRMARTHAHPRLVHIAGRPPTTRHDWAVRVMGPDVPIDAITRAEYSRPSTVPEHAVLSTALASELGIPEITWQDAVEATP